VASGGTVTIGSRAAAGGEAKAKAEAKAEAEAAAEAAAEVAAITTDTATIARGIRIIGATTRRETAVAATIVVINNTGATATSKVRMTSMVSNREAQIEDGGTTTLPGRHLRHQTVAGTTAAAAQRQNSEKG